MKKLIYIISVYFLLHTSVFAYKCTLQSLNENLNKSELEIIYGNTQKDINDLGKKINEATEKGKFEIEQAGIRGVNAIRGIDVGILGDLKAEREKALAEAHKKWDTKTYQARAVTILTGYGRADFQESRENEIQRINKTFDTRENFKNKTINSSYSPEQSVRDIRDSYINLVEMYSDERDLKYDSALNILKMVKCAEYINHFNAKKEEYMKLKVFLEKEKVVFEEKYPNTIGIINVDDVTFIAPLNEKFPNMKSEEMFLDVYPNILSATSTTKVSPKILFEPSLATNSTPTKFISTTHKLGSKSSEVEILQKYLKEQKYNIKVTGYFGPMTQKMLRLYQKDNKLKITGQADKKTIDFINSRLQ